MIPVRVAAVKSIKSAAVDHSSAVPDSTFLIKDATQSFNQTQGEPD